MATVDPINQFYAKFKRYPGNNKQWWVARADVDDDEKNIEAGDFVPEVLDKIFAGNTRAPRGHYILKAFDKDRSAVSGISGLEREITKERPSSVTFFAGRAFYGCLSTVYFSQLLTDRYRAGLCYQEADPTSEGLSDLVATDGGVIPIPQAQKINRLVATADGVLVFAENGVWNISGGDGGFSAVDISVSKISPIGCKSPRSVVESEEGVFWWSDVGIMGMQAKLGMYGPIPGSFEKTNISEPSIQSFYNDIEEEAKAEVKGIHDTKNGRIVWLYRDSEVPSTCYNRCLLFDLSLGAFYPWKFSQVDSATPPYIKGIHSVERLNNTTVSEDIVVGSDTVQVAGETVVHTIATAESEPSTIEFMSLKGTLGGRFCQVRNTNFVDWEVSNGVGVTYESYVETGYELFDDAMRNKNITYLFSYLRRTEEEYVGDELVNPSSCYLTVKWDWANTSKSNKWSTPVQVYRFNRFLPMEGGVFDTGFPIVVTKNKVRGSGKSIQFRFGTDERERNFDLHGWSIAVTGNTSP